MHQDRTWRFRVRGLAGYELTSWVVGEDVDEEAWRRFRDSGTRHLTAMTVLRDGEGRTFLVEKAEWPRLKARIGLSRAAPQGPSIGVRKFGDATLGELGARPSAFWRLHA